MSRPNTNHARTVGRSAFAKVAHRFSSIHLKYLYSAPKSRTNAQSQFVVVRILSIVGDCGARQMAIWFRTYSGFMEREAPLTNGGWTLGSWTHPADGDTSQQHRWRISTQEQQSWKWFAAVQGASEDCAELAWCGHSVEPREKASGSSLTLVVSAVHQLHQRVEHCSSPVDNLWRLTKALIASFVNGCRTTRSWRNWQLENPA